MKESKPLKLFGDGLASILVCPFFKERFIFSVTADCIALASTRERWQSGALD